jgi:hypothetical protein
MFHYFSQPQRGCINRSCAGGCNPFRVVEFSERFPRVARSSQPWAECRYPVGVNKCPAVVANKSRTFAARHGVPPMGYRGIEVISAGQTRPGHPSRFGAGKSTLRRLGWRWRLTVHGLRPGGAAAPPYHKTVGLTCRSAAVSRPPQKRSSSWTHHPAT